MSYWFDPSKLEFLINSKREAFKHATGQHMINEMAAMAHKKLGTLANSMNYTTDDNENSGFNSSHGKGTPPSSAKVSIPKKDYVRAGSALVYAGRQEKHNGWASKAFDNAVVNKLFAITKKVLKF